MGSFAQTAARVGRFLVAAWLAVGVLLMAFPAAAYEGPSAERPNVVWILLDALRAKSLSCYGYDRPTTPNLDKLAGRGVLFEHHLTQGLGTLDSVPSYMTGRYFAASCMGHLDWWWLMMTPPPGEVLAPTIMRENGYQTLLVSAHNSITPDTRLWRAFDRAVSEYGNFEALNKAMLDAVDARKPGVPFFLYTHAMDTHFPHNPQPPYDRWVPEGAHQFDPPYSEEEQAYLRGIYDGSLAYADAQIGLLLDAFEARGLLDKTIFIIASDHGEMLGEDGAHFSHDYTACDEMLHIPLIMAGPGLRSGVRVSTVTENVDIVPTLIDLLGLRTGAQPDGTSLLPLVEAPDMPDRRDFWFCWKRGNLSSAGAFVVRHEGFLHTVESGITRLFEAPCPLRDRKDRAAEHPEMVARIEAYIGQTLVPMAQAFEQRPRVEPSVFYVELPPAADPEDGWVAPASDSNMDNKWTLRKGRLTVASGEAAPPLSMKLGVPDGEYDVLMEIGNAEPECAVVCRLSRDGEWRVFRSADAGLGLGRAFGFVRLGACSVDGSTLELEVKQAAPGRAGAVVTRLKLTPRSLLGTQLERTPGQESDAAAGLRALGYLE